MALLSRTRDAVPGFKDWLEVCIDGLSSEEKRRTSGSTVHKFKGMEADVAIIVDASSRRFPLIPGTWPLFRVFGDSVSSLIEDERQLLYVAVTRAAQRVICVVESDRASGSLSNLFGDAEQQFARINWTDYKMPRRDGARACLAVVSNLPATGVWRGGTPAIKEELKAAGFTYSTGGGPQWSRSMTLDVNGDAQKVLEALRREKWAAIGDGIVVQLRDGFEDALGAFRVTAGEWVAL